jgi:hypothetical protein
MAADSSPTRRVAGATPLQVCLGISALFPSVIARETYIGSAVQGIAVGVTSLQR